MPPLGSKHIHQYNLILKPLQIAISRLSLVITNCTQTKEPFLLRNKLKNQSNIFYLIMSKAQEIVSP